LRFKKVSKRNFPSSNLKEANDLLQNTLVKHLLSFNMPNIDGLFGGFAEGDFAVFYGMPTILDLSLLLAVRAQLPFQLGGLETNVVFVDGSNSFRLYQVSHLAQLHQLDPRQVLERIYISRAFTAYQMTSLILEKLKESVRLRSKLVIISDVTGLYLDDDIPPREAKEVFSQLTLYLSRFSQENHLIVIATCLPHSDSKQDTFFRAMACGRASVALSVKPSRFGERLFLEKHPSLHLGYAEFSSESLTLDQFMEVIEYGKNS
jgi:hypothetical protein